MPMWLFGRRGGKAAKLKSGGGSTSVAGPQRPVAGTAHDVFSSDALRRPPSRRSSRRRRRSSPSLASMRDVEKNSPPLTPIDPAFEKAFEKQFLHQYPSAEDITALPVSRRLEHSPHLRPVTQDHAIAYNFHSPSHASLPPPRERRLQRRQSQRKPGQESLIRRKSSKKREHDAVREEEIRAMSMPLPQKRPAGSSGGMLRRDSKKVKGGLNRHFERPTSNISLPMQESIHSSMSSGSESRAFRVSALDMFSPRPKIRCSTGSQYYYTGSSPSPHHGRGDARREERATVSRDDKEGKRSKTIDDLADTLDAGALREILERDKRRREKKRKADDERLRRRLERRAEKQKAAENGAVPLTPRRETRQAREAVGLGIEKETYTPMEDVRPSTPPRTQTQPQPLDIPTPSKNSQLPTPLDSPVEEPVVADARAIRYSKASMATPTSPTHTHTRGPSNISQMPELLSETVARETPVESVEHEQDAHASGSLHPVRTADTTATSSKSFSRRRSSEGRRMGVFASLFRRGKRNSQDQTQTTPSEISFSNTSRESMSRQPLPAHLVAPTQPIQIRRPSRTPHRTMSKFREDLPEFPLSPPDSRMQSPEATSSSANAAHRRSQGLSDLRVSSSSPGLVGRTDSPVSPGVPATGLMSQSLASVDSEASWLSGKPMQRRSNKSHVRSSIGSTSAVKRNEDFNASYEELGIPDDEYFKRLTPQPDERLRSANSAEILARKPSSTAMAVMDPTVETDADVEDDDAPVVEGTSGETGEQLVQSSVGRQPTIVHRQPRVKSTEGLLSHFEADRPSPEEKTEAHGDDLAEPESPASEGEMMVVQRAKSIDVGKHHTRQLSAGSARLLHIPAKRSSAEPRRPHSASPSVAPNPE